ncbi:DNA-3-methyladenine glycosylase II [Lihuaxuella thermophila]|uniref:DNA-3-methyladenine glycosylase II n=2 Tax=Lihuaxuella thermophila TaxID=1173111 RepID=A0A1H8IYA7_9BACL|nr:DNA-3-methyladenine glycosylase II [Lihuaxuella thermophila]
MLEFMIECNYPYSFPKTTKRLRYFEKSMYVYQDGMFTRTLRGKKGPLVVSVSESRTPSVLLVKVEGDLAEGEEEQLKATMRHMFSTEVDLTPFYRQWQEDSLMGRVVREREGMHIVLDPTVYECLIKTIVGQQLNISFAATLLKRLIQLAGEAVEFQGGTLPVFPSPEQVARLNYEDLQQLQFNRRKAEYIIDISRQVAEGKLDLDALSSLSDEQIAETLLPLRGVGRWTVECVMLFGLGRPDLLPAADIGLRNAVRRVYGLDEQPSEQEVRRIGEAWAPYRSYATFYLWDTLSQHG